MLGGIAAHAITYIQTALLLVGHGAAVLAGSLPELCGLCLLDHTPLVPVTDGMEALLFLLLWTLMRQRRSGGDTGEAESVTN